MLSSYRRISNISGNGFQNNLNYAMCIERTSETCSVTYSNVGYMQIVNYDTGEFCLSSYLLYLSWKLAKDLKKNTM